MSDLEASIPRVFLARHGETEWTKNGRFTGSTELDLIETSRKQVENTATQLDGAGKLISPTFKHLFGTDIPINFDKVVPTEDITEWDYGDYEGMLMNDIRAQRKKKGLDEE